MSEATLSIDVNKQICDAEGCSAPATQEIKVSVGRMGDIYLSTCENCVRRFINDGETAQVR